MSEITLWIQEKKSSAGGDLGIGLALPLENEPLKTEDAKLSVRNNGSYSIALTCPQEKATDCSQWRLWLNGKILPSIPHWDQVLEKVVVPLDDKPFRDLLGFALFSLRFDPDVPEAEVLFAPPLRVLLDDQSLSQLTKEIASYVTDHAQGILVNRKAPKITFTKGSPSRQADFPEVIHFLTNIVQAYQYDADYFRSNSRSRIQLAGRVDSIERLRYFTPETLRFISMHPEELAPASSSTGIRFGGLSYEPVRTWIQGDKVDRNVYENQIVLGFLSTVIAHTEELIQQTGVRNQEEDKTIDLSSDDSALLIRGASKKQLLEIGTALLTLNDRLRRLFILYKEFMGAEPAHVTRVPEPTAVFLSIPAYNRIYNLLHRWFNVREVNLEKNSFFMDAWRTSRAYEYYCLIRLIEEIKAEDFTLEHQIEYPWKHSTEIIQGERINNVYYLKKGTEKITVYYEPVIGCLLNKDSGLMLFKNSTGYLSGYRTGLRFVQGSLESWYTPDFVVKYDSKEGTKYLIADAKFSTQEEVVALQLITMLFKYQLSISTAYKKDVISGLSIFCGKRSHGFTPMPLFNVQNPISGVSRNARLTINQIMPGSDEKLLPDGFLCE